MNVFRLDGCHSKRKGMYGFVFDFWLDGCHGKGKGMYEIVFDFWLDECHGKGMELYVFVGCGNIWMNVRSFEWISSYGERWMYL